MIKFKVGDRVVINPELKGFFRFKDLSWWEKNKDKTMIIDSIGGDMGNYICTVKENVSYWPVDWFLKVEESKFFSKEEFEI